MISYLYPHTCWECEMPLEIKEALFCTPCQYLLYPLRKDGRCKTCFQEELPCSFCKKNKSPYTAIGAVYDHFGPAEKIVRALDNGRAPYLTKGVSGALISTFLQWEWKMPDYVTHLPTPPQKRLLRGYEPNKLIALEFANLLDIPFVSILETPKEGNFRASKEAFFPNKRILLIGDVIDEDRLFPCGEALTETYAIEVFCLCFTTCMPSTL